jgi:ankyrin repeat protein
MLARLLFAKYNPYYEIDRDLPDESGWPPLLSAGNNSRLSPFSLSVSLLSLSLSLSYIIIAANGHIGAVSLLVDSGADARCLSARGKSALHYLCQVKLLLS